MSDTFVGVDVAKAEFVVACRPAGVGWTAANDPSGIADTVAQLRTMTPTLIVVEATGGYERALVATLAAAGLPLVVVNPRLVGHRLTTGSSLRIVAVRFR
jgi:transposase